MFSPLPLGDRGAGFGLHRIETCLQAFAILSPLVQETVYLISGQPGGGFLDRLKAAAPVSPPRLLPG
jgi:hypothetical protein